MVGGRGEEGMRPGGWKPKGGRDEEKI